MTGSGITQAELRNLIADALRLWDVAARVEAAEDGLRIGPCTVARADPPWRWTLQTEMRAAAGRLPRPCPSVLVLLAGLRRALGAAPP